MHDYTTATFPLQRQVERNRTRICADERESTKNILVVGAVFDRIFKINTIKNHVNLGLGKSGWAYWASRPPGTEIHIDNNCIGIILELADKANFPGSLPDLLDPRFPEGGNLIFRRGGCDANL
jgi:hypothetical protein